MNSKNINYILLLQFKYSKNYINTNKKIKTFSAKTQLQNFKSKFNYKFDINILNNYNYNINYQIWKTYYFWHLNSLFYNDLRSKRQLQILNKNSIRFSNNISSELQNKIILLSKKYYRKTQKEQNIFKGIPIYKKSTKLKNLMFYLKYYEYSFTNYSQKLFLNFPLFKNFELSRQILSYILI